MRKHIFAIPAADSWQDFIEPPVDPATMMVIRIRRRLRDLRKQRKATRRR